MNSKDTPAIVPRIFAIRGESVMLDSDLAILYGVETRAFNQAIKRNTHRFPADFMFQVTADEWDALRSQFVTLKTAGRGQHRKYLPLVFTEHGAIMAATILSSERAVAMSVYVVRAFVKMRRELLADATLEARLQKIEKTLLSHDSALREVIQKLRPLLLPPPPDPPKRRIGFYREGPGAEESM
jgi:phage regulator Rha-like protein